MRVKPRGEWHNFDFTAERDLGELEVAISLNAEVLRRFVQYAQDRVARGTGIRFKFTGRAAQEVVQKKDGRYVAYQVYAEHPYIFPNDSPHTNRFDSPYNRVEFYIPLERLQQEQPVEASEWGWPVEEREQVLAAGPLQLTLL